MIEAREERQLARMKKQLAKLDLLILDELGYVPTSKLGAELLFDVISTAYERTSLIVTTNLPFENWTEVLGSERLTGATLDRLTHRCHILEATGESYRLQDARRRQAAGQEINVKLREKKGKIQHVTQRGDANTAAARDPWKGSRGPLSPHKTTRLRRVNIHVPLRALAFSTAQALAFWPAVHRKSEHRADVRGKRSRGN